MRNPIQYTSRTFESIFADLNAEPELASKPDWWKRVWAGVGDVISIWNNAAANNSYLRTAFSRRAVSDILQLIGYQLSPATTASGKLLFDIDRAAVLPQAVLREDLVGIIPSRNTVSERRFEARAGITVSEVLVSAAASEWNTGDDTITVPSAFVTGERVRIQTPGTLPIPIDAGTDYWVVRVSSTVIRLAVSRAAAFGGQFLDITNAGTGGHEIVRLSREVAVWQQRQIPAFEIATSDGAKQWQEYMLPDRDVILESVGVTIDGLTWDRVSTFAFSGVIDLHFRINYLTDGTAVLEFGNGDYGLIPGNFPIFVTYAVGGGPGSNVGSPNRVTVYGGGAALITGCTNSELLSGGGAPETVENAKRVAPLLLKSRDRFVTAEDGEVLALNFGGLSQVRVVPNAFGLLTCLVTAIASGGGNPPGPLKADIKNYLEERSVLGSIAVTFDDTVITPISVTSAAKLRPGFAWADVEPFFRLAWELTLSEVSVEIRDTYIDAGLGAALDLINSVFTETFTEAEGDDLRRLLDSFERFPPIVIGGEIQESFAISFIQGGVLGVDYMTISAPAFPIINAVDEITTVGTLTLTEIP